MALNYALDVRLGIMKVLVFGFFSLAVLLGSCSSPTPPSDDGPGLYGQISLEDSTGTPILPPYSGITVSIPRNTSISADSLGNWRIPNPPQGNYNLIFSKEGFGSTSYKESYIITYNTWTYSEPGNGMPFVLTQAPDSIVRVEKVLDWDSTSPGTPQSMALFVTAKASRVFYFIDSTPNVPSTGVHTSGPIEIYEHNANQWYGDMDWLSNYGFHHGETVYVTACAASAATRYLDVNNHEALGNVGPSSNAYPIVIP